MISPRVLIRQASARLSQAGISDPETDASLILAHLTGKQPLSLRLDVETILPEKTVTAFELMISRRMKREPVQYILGQVSFCGRIFSVSPGILIPRPETELLSAWAVQEAASIPAPRILDLCCGSGCIGITMALSLPRSSVTLTDISPEAVSVSSGNAERLNAPVRILQGDLFNPVKNEVFDLIISNPPYIPSEECPLLQEEVRFEPSLALDGGKDGLDFYRRIASMSAARLVPGGLLMMELGFGQASAVVNLLAAAGMKKIQIRKDYAGIERMILARTGLRGKEENRLAGETGVHERPV